MINIDLYARIGAQLCGKDLENPAAQFVGFLFNHRLEVAQQITESHPRFAPVLQAMQVSHDALMNDDERLGDLLGAEFNAMFELFQSQPDLANDVYFAVLMAAQGTFLERFSDDRAMSVGMVSVVDNTMTEGLSGLPAIALLTQALWFADFKNYRARMYQQNYELKQEGWYE